MQVMMSDTQINGIVKYLKETDHMLEYGSGGSTLMFSSFVKSYHSIEHHREWFDKVSIKINDADKYKNVSYHYIPPTYIGEDKGSLYAKECLTKKDLKDILQKFPLLEENNVYSSAGRYSQFSKYIDHIDKLNQKKWDKILIDGRARTSCAYKILPYIDKNSIVFIDDYYRQSYEGKTRGIVEFGNQLFNVYEPIDRIDTMLIIRKK